MGRGINAVLWVGTLLGGAIGTLALGFALVLDSAPQQAAAAALGTGAAVVPYVIARAFHALRTIDSDDHKRA